MKVTINDVAKLAGVSIKTVSRVINNEESVRQNTRDKVMAAAAELNYQPNQAARNLAGTKSYTIGFIYDNPNAYYIIDMQNGILSECRKQGFELVIHPCNSKSDGILDEIKEMIKQSRITGLVLTPPFSENDDVIAMLDQLDVRYVRIISGSGAEQDSDSCVMIDDHQAAQDITDHLIQLGHKDIAFIGGSDEHQSSFERLSGYQAALKAHHVAPQNDLIVAGDYSFDSGVVGANKLLELEQKPSAIFCCNDETAAGALFAARLKNISIPDELSIVGFEDSPFSRQTWPKLTTAHQPNQQIASQATSLLIANTRNQSANEICRLFTPKLVIRDSSQQAPS
ncbi:LacI family DNA-binding transcriptional regulator [Neiella marina]|uniref:LacI family DNA-binding transcriptional regulator n=1 Tax=Neiella holothuriorum TaxID=2870530 RepID=A0ABS7EAS5_9GAMM|nr:LacI family DNA-binding transcriptional regulator [Neiella holothuriorum]MBW8189430.1 LacI family DNA-binding transcriptional regulator [Neiella holothuriorum]